MWLEFHPCISGKTTTNLLESSQRQDREDRPVLGKNGPLLCCVSCICVSIRIDTGQYFFYINKLKAIKKANKKIVTILLLQFKLTGLSRLCKLCFYLNFKGISIHYFAINVYLPQFPYLFIFLLSICLKTHYIFVIIALKDPPG